MLLDLVSHVFVMNVLHVVDPFALRCIYDAMDLLLSRLTFCR